MEPALIKPGAEGDRPGIADVPNFTIMNSNATLVAEPVSAAGRAASCCPPLAARAGPGGGPHLAHRDSGEHDGDPEQQDHQADDLRLEL
jgi:hypothetical protein